jgi:hypothetical protein
LWTVLVGLTNEDLELSDELTGRALEHCYRSAEEIKEEKESSNKRIQKTNFHHVNERCKLFLVCY